MTSQYPAAALVVRIHFEVGCDAAYAGDEWRAASNAARTGIAANSSGTGARVAADAGHPRSLQIKEETILQEIIDFMGRRIFGPGPDPSAAT